MKLKNEQEIENLADAKHRQLNIARKVWTFKDGFIQGYTQAQQDLLASVSEGFEEWENKTIQDNGGSFPDFIEPEDLWQAAKLSSAKELEELKAELEKLKRKAVLTDHYKFYNCDCPVGMDCDCSWSKGEAK